MPRQRLTAGALAASVVLVGASACTDAQVGDPQSAEQDSTSAQEFVGSPREYSDALAACLEQLGWRINHVDEGFTVDMAGRTDDEYIAAYEGCVADVGVAPSTNLSDTELRARYDWRLEQYQCLVDAGFAVGDPVSFETFVDTYERTGIATWDPIEPLAQDAGEVERANGLCPYSTAQW